MKFPHNILIYIHRIVCLCKLFGEICQIVYVIKLAPFMKKFQKELSNQCLILGQEQELGWIL